jgi:integrase/recombinase XerD
MTGVRFLFRVTLKRHDLAAELYHLKEPEKLPLILSPDEGPRHAGPRLWLRAAGW